MISSHRLLLTFVFFVSLLAASVVSFGQGFSDDFESYTPSEDLPFPWADWASGLSPSTGNQALYWTVHNKYGHDGSLQYMQMELEPVRWFDNPYDARDRIVDITFYVRTESESGLDFFAGSMGWTPSAAPTEQYGTNVGALHIRHHVIWSPSYVEWYQVAYGAQNDTENFIADGEFWNEIKIHTVVRNINTMMGEGELFVNGVGTGETHIWRLNTEYGLSGLDLYGWDWNREFDIDDISILQNGFADPIGIPVPDYIYPSTMGSGGGITSDGTQYLYILGGGNSAGTGSSELWRFDAIAGTWDQLPSSPTVTHPDNPTAVLTSQAQRCALTTAGAEGTISMTMNSANSSRNPWQVDYNISVGAWSAAVGAPSDFSSWDSFGHVEAAGDRLYATGSPSQAGMLIYDAGTDEFLARQGSPNTFPFHMIGNDLAYANDGNNWLYGLGYRDRDPDPGVVDAITTIGRYDLTQDPPGSWDWSGSWWWYTDAPVAFPNPREGFYYPPGKHGLTYVPEGINNIFVIHTVWGETGLFKINVVGGALFAVVYQSDDLYRYDIATDTWTTITDGLPFEFDLGDDLTFGVPLLEDPVLTISQYDENNVELSWDSVTTRKYKLWESADLAGWVVSQDWQTGTGATMSVVKSTTGVDKKFYKLERDSLP